MDANLRYLRVIGRQFGKPLQALTQDKRAAHLVLATGGALTRVVADMELAGERRRALQAGCKDWSVRLRTLSGTGAGANAEYAQAAAALDALSQGEAADTIEKIEAELARVLALLARNGDTVARGLVADIVGNESHYRQQLEDKCTELRADVIAENAAVPGSLDEAQQQRLLGLLRQRDGADTLRIASVTPVPGGYSKQTIMVELENPKTLPTQLVVRHDRPESPVDTSVTLEFPLLQALHAAGVKVPQPWLLDRGDVIGAPLMVVSRAQGNIVADGQHFHQPTAGHANYAVTLAQEMAKLHAVPVAQLPRELAGHDKSNVDVMRAELEDFQQVWRQYHRKVVAVEAAFHWLFAHLDAIGEEKSVTHGDLRFHNMLVDEHGVTAILDWELTKIHHPALDVGYVYHHVRQLMDWREFLSHYAAAGGKVPSRQTQAFYILRSEILISTMLTKIEMGFLSGAHEMIDLAYAGSQLRQYSLYLLAQRLKMVLDGTDF